MEIVNDKLVYGCTLTKEQFDELKYRPENAHLDETEEYYGIIEDPSWGISTDDVPTPIPENYNNATTAEDVEAAIEERGEEAEIAATSADAVDALSGKTVKNIIIEPAEGETIDINTNVTFNATENITIDGITVSGEKGSSNAKVLFDSQEVTVKNVEDGEGQTVYNMFEQKQNGEELNEFTAANVEISESTMKHNVFNIYRPAANAEIVIRNCNFTLDADNSNILRLANYANVDNVKITFENVNWTYTEKPEDYDWSWAGLIIYQPASTDEALSGNLEHLQTWSFTFKNCKYNDVAVTANNFGEENQVMYLYNIAGSGTTSDPVAEGLNISFINSK